MQIAGGPRVLQLRLDSERRVPWVTPICGAKATTSAVWAVFSSNRRYADFTGAISQRIVPRLLSVTKCKGRVELTRRYGSNDSMTRF